MNTTFLTTQTLQSASEAHSPLERSLSTKSMDVLLVEDSPGDARLLEENLKEFPSAQVILSRVETIEQALEALMVHEYEAVLLDLSLPDSFGMDTLERVHAAAPHVPIVVLTGWQDEQAGLEALHEGAQDYLVKGEIDAHQLVRSLRYAIERHRMQAELRDLSFMDELTGLYNRRGFLTLAAQQLKTARRQAKECLLFYADLDGLKEINDTYGHREGDRAIVETAEVLKETFRASDILARPGGDEFTVLAVDAGSDRLKAITARLEEVLAQHNARPDRLYNLSLSYGVGVYSPSKDVTLEELMADADGKLYKVKRARKAGLTEC